MMRVVSLSVARLRAVLGLLGPPRTASWRDHGEALHLQPAGAALGPPALPEFRRQAAADPGSFGPVGQCSSPDRADWSRRRAYGSRWVHLPRGHGADDVHVLLVEDRAVVREAVAAMFEREGGFAVHQAESLTEARRMLEGVDVAILDLTLPDGNGAELIGELHDINPDAKAIVLSSSIDPVEADQARERGAAAVLSKLDDFDQVIETVRHL